MARKATRPRSLGRGRYRPPDRKRQQPQERLGPGLRLSILARRHGAFRGDGAFGQFCVVLPEQDAVIAITSGVKDMQSVLDLVWDQLLPAMKPAPLATDKVARSELENKVKSLSLRPLEGKAWTASCHQGDGQEVCFSGQ